MKKLNLALAVLATSTMLFSCGEKKADTTTTPTETPAETTAAPEEVTGVQITLNADDQMKFDQTEIRVPVGEKVTLTLKHTGKMDKAIMGHNWVLLKPGTDMTAFATEAAQATETDYIHPSGLENVVAHTKTLGGGQSDTIEFTITEAGTYDFLCTFPAHFALMQGKLIAE
ncbi:azurin [Myroides odoratimimus]|uniref:azurin n=1 Tax=Myroides TaxID=76831 RepID=UPI000245F91F|nr:MULTISPECIES: azurin [Myroides]APA90964.1 azurin [Myroides sp. ZB35]EHO06485.1 azurin [Myroides odoratimimus CCUG 12901]EKB02278.1 azurin [Myroides odoratimimus CCUG 3837]MCA4792902.1 azurin [Myroides odoratimimus]MCA4807934.1 azurin [Myroides odoratimimus]